MITSKMNGIMLDPARVMEKFEVYERMLPYLSQWGYDTIFWHFCDDPYCRIQFKSHPELAAEISWSPEKTCKFIALAKKFNITVIPEIESLGHTSYITNNPKWKHLADGLEGKGFAAIAPFHPETRILLAELIAEVAEIFSDSPIIHTGLDEVAFGDHPTSQEYLKTHDKQEAFAAHTNWLNAEVRKHGKQMAIWGDHLRDEAASNMADSEYIDIEATGERIAELVDKNILLCDWHYQPNMPKDRLDQLINKGFEVLACPAISSYGMMGHPCQRNLDNIEEFNQIAKANKERGCLGTVNTVWCTGRYLFGTSLAGLALGATFAKGENVDRVKCIRDTLELIFGVEDAKDAARAIMQMHTLAPKHHTLYCALFPIHEYDIRKIKTDEIMQIETIENNIKAIQKSLSAASKKITRNHDWFEDILDTTILFAELPMQLKRIQANNFDVDTVNKLAKHFQKAWARTRYENDKERDGDPAKNCIYITQRNFCY